MRKIFFIIVVLFGLCTETLADDRTILDYSVLTTPATDDYLLLSDTSASGAYKRLSLANVFASGVTSGLNVPFNSVTIGGLGLTGSISTFSFVANSGYNAADSSAGSTILGGRSGYPNKIGYAGKPAGTAYTPTDWADDTGYVADSSEVAAICGGYDSINNQAAGVIAGGGHNFLKYNVDAHSVIGGGSYNLVSAGRSVIAGGRRNTITGAKVFSVIGGGDNNNIVGSYSSIIGGLSNMVTGDYSLASGRRAQATANGAVALSDSQDSDFSNTTANSFAARFSGGYLLTGGDVNTGSATDGIRISSATGYGDIVGVDNAANGYNSVRIKTGSSMYPMILTTTGDIQVPKTITTAGTTGAQTINKVSGSVNLAASASSLVVTNSLVAASSVIQCTVGANDATTKSVQCVAGAGSFTIFPNAVPSAETRVNFSVTN